MGAFRTEAVGEGRIAAQIREEYGELDDPAFLDVPVTAIAEVGIFSAAANAADPRHGAQHARERRVTHEAIRTRAAVIHHNGLCRDLKYLKRAYVVGRPNRMHQSSVQLEILA